MHQNILTDDDNHDVSARRILVTSIYALVGQLDLIQITLMMRRLGDYDNEQFVVTGPSVYCTTLKGLNRQVDNINERLDQIEIIFDGGPSEHQQFRASVRAYVADRVIRCIRDYGRTKVCEIIEEIVAWKNGTPPFKTDEDYEEEKSDEWDEIAAAERYAG